MMKTNAMHLEEILNAIDEREKELRDFLKKIKEETKDNGGSELPLNGLIFLAKRKLKSHATLSQKWIKG